MIVSLYHPYAFSQLSFDNNLYKEYAKEILLLGIDPYNRRIESSNKHLKRKDNLDKIEPADTANIEFSIPILTLKFLSQEFNKDSLLLIDLIDYSSDPYSQIAFIKNNNFVNVIYIVKGICQRWEKTMMDNLENRNFEDYRIPPGYTDSTLVISSTLELESPKQKFNYSHFKTYLQDHSDVQVFKVYPMKELWTLNDGVLKKLSFSPKRVEEEDGEIYFSKLLEKYGIERLEQVIGGGEWEQVIYQ